jgi:hypothetical protein
VYEDVSQAERLGGTTRLKGFVSRFAESIGQHWDRHVAQALSRFTHSVVRSKSPTKEVTCQRQKRPLAVLHKMGRARRAPASPYTTTRSPTPSRLAIQCGRQTGDADELPLALYLRSPQLSALQRSVQSHKERSCPRTPDRRDRWLCSDDRVHACLSPSIQNALNCFDWRLC